MAFYSVHQSPDLTSPALLDAPRRERPVFVREGFSPFAFFLPIFWPLAYGQVLSFLALLAGNLVVLSLAVLLQLPLYAILGIFLAGDLLVAFEAGNWRRRQIDKKGWPVVNMLEAKSAREAKRMYGEVLRVNGVLPAPSSTSAPTPTPAPVPEAPVPVVALEAEEPEPAKPEAEIKKPSPGRLFRDRPKKPAAPPAPIPLRGREGLDTLSLFQLRDRPQIKDRGAIGPPVLHTLTGRSQENLTAPPSGAKEKPRRRPRRH